jgi:hypothetical protein
VVTLRHGVRIGPRQFEGLLSRLHDLAVINPTSHTHTHTCTRTYTLCHSVIDADGGVTRDIRQDGGRKGGGRREMENLLELAQNTAEVEGTVDILQRLFIVWLLELVL